MSDNTIAEIHTAEVAFFTDKMPYLQMVRAYEPQLLNGKTAIETPALLLDMVQITPEKKLSGDNTPVNIEFAAHCVLSMKTKNYEIEVRNFASKVLQLVFQNKFGLTNCLFPTELYAYAGNFSYELGFDSWIVSWSQQFYLPPVDPVVVPDWLPQRVWLGEVPNVGPDHIDDYQLIFDGTQQNDGKNT